MPCWTTTTTRVEIAAEGRDKERLIAAGKVHGVDVLFSEGKVTLRDWRGRDSAAVERLVKQEYASMTVSDGLRKFGFRVQKQQTTAEGGRKLTVGR